MLASVTLTLELSDLRSANEKALAQLASANEERFDSELAEIENFLLSLYRFAVLAVRSKQEIERAAALERSLRSARQDYRQLIRAVRVAVDPAYYRPTEVDLLLGDASKAKRLLGWEAKTQLPDLASMMAKSDLEALQRSPATSRAY